jgi:hypothetical protein
MSKGQHGNKELKKPKKAPAPVVPAASDTVVRTAATVAVAPRKK